MATTGDHIKGPALLMMAMEIQNSIRMEAMDTTIMEAMDTTTTMDTTIMVAKVTTITNRREVMAITMEIPMGGTIRSISKGILVSWSASSATRMDTMPAIALRGRRMKGTRPISSRKDM
jgi:ribosomal protein L17